MYVVWWIDKQRSLSCFWYCKWGWLIESELWFTHSSACVWRVCETRSWIVLRSRKKKKIIFFESRICYRIDSNLARENTLFSSHPYTVFWQSLFIFLFTLAPLAPTRLSRMARCFGFRRSVESSSERETRYLSEANECCFNEKNSEITKSSKFSFWVEDKQDTHCSHIMWTGEWMLVLQWIRLDGCVWTKFGFLNTFLLVRDLKFSIFLLFLISHSLML